MRISRPKVSVVIPAYNSERFIAQTIESVLNQTYRSFELIIIDDGSTDETEKAISKYEGRIIYVRKKNEGISMARNAGIEIAQGDYIAFIDHDDVWLPEKLEKQTALLEANKEIGLCFSNAYIIDEKGKRKGNLFNISSPHKGINFKELLKENFIPVITAVVRKGVFEEIGLFNPRYRIAEDWDLFLRISKRYPIAFINRPLAEYRVHAGSFSQQRGLMISEVVAIIDEYIGFVNKPTQKRLQIIRQKFQKEKGL